jgi:hypothetical protein
VAWSGAGAVGVCGGDPPGGGDGGKKNGGGGGGDRSGSIKKKKKKGARRWCRTCQTSAVSYPNLDGALASWINEFLIYQIKTWLTITSNERRSAFLRRLRCFVALVVVSVVFVVLREVVAGVVDVDGAVGVARVRVPRPRRRAWSRLRTMSPSDQSDLLCKDELMVV